MSHQTPLYSIHCDLQKLPRWKLRLVRVVMKALLFHYRVEVWSHYWFHQFYTATAHRVGGFIANRSAFVFWVGVEFGTEAE